MESLHTISFTFVGDLLVIVHETPLPHPEEWSAMMVAVHEHGALEGVLVVAGDARPGPEMRKDVQAVTRKFGCLTAVLTDSVVAKGVMVAMTWLRIPIRGFRSEELAQALEYLGCSTALDSVRAVVQPHIDRSMSGVL